LIEVCSFLAVLSLGIQRPDGSSTSLSNYHSWY